MTNARRLHETERRRRHPRGWGAVRKLPSGRFQASYLDDAGKRHNAPATFPSGKAADAWLSHRRAARDASKLPNPDAGSATFADYAASWLATRPLRPRTKDEYGKILAGHLVPAFGKMALADITAGKVRSWHAGLKTGPTRKAHAYGLLHAILNTAVTDGEIPANPAHIRGAANVKRAKTINPPELGELAAITKAMRPEYRAAVLIAAWLGLRFGEVAALTRADIDLTAGVVRVRRGVTHIANKPVIGEPKTTAGIRNVHIPPHLVPVLKTHLAEHVGKAPGSLLFVSPSGRHLRSDSRMHREFRTAAAKAGRPDLTFHGLRHFGATNAARAGATPAELMHRLGHSTVNAAMLYQHATSARDKQIAAALSAMASAGGGGTVVEMPAPGQRAARKRQRKAGPA